MAVAVIIATERVASLPLGTVSLLDVGTMAPLLKEGLAVICKLDEM